jgi:hypothetical protein
VLWYAYLGVIWSVRTFGHDAFANAVVRADPAPYELPAALACMLLASAFVGAKSSEEAERLEARIEERRLADDIAAIEASAPQDVIR